MARKKVSFYAKNRQGRKVRVSFYARTPKTTRTTKITKTTRTKKRTSKKTG